MAKFKACGSTFAKCTSNKLADSKNVGDAVTIGKMIEVTVKPNFKEALLYADDEIAEQIREFDSAEVTLNIDEIAIEAAVEIFGLKKASSRNIPQFSSLKTEAQILTMAHMASYMHPLRTALRPTMYICCTESSSSCPKIRSRRRAKILHSQHLPFPERPTKT